MNGSTSGRRKNRSPSYPGIGLHRAVELIMALYAHEQFHPVSYRRAAQIFGYSPASSNSQRAFAAVKQFGLVEERGASSDRYIQLTRLGKRVVLGYKTEPADFTSALQESVLHPTIYELLWTRWNSSLPDDEELKRFLVLELQFNPHSVDAFLADYRGSITFAGLLEPVSGGMIPVRETIERTRVSDLEERVTVVSVPEVAPVKTTNPSNQSTKRILEIPFQLIDGGQAVLKLPVPLSERDFDLLSSLIEANLSVMKRVIVAA